jgi:endo-1,4-beta-D-glucanase Y
MAWLVLRNMSICASAQGYQIYLTPNIPKREKYTKIYNIYQTAINYTKALQIIYTNWDFKNKPSGNPA